MIDVAANPSDAVEKALDLFGNDILRLAYSYMKSREECRRYCSGGTDSPYAVSRSI